MSIELLHGDCLSVLKTLPSGSVSCCVTSPPYYGLRSYLPDGHEDKGLEVGLEQTPEQYVARMVEVFREVKRVLRDDGTLWLNIGDSYAQGGNGPGSRHYRETMAGRATANARALPRKKAPAGYKSKDLIGIPWMLAFALRADGWYLRSDIIWNKPNAMPESVKDRPTKAHEYIFLLSKSQTYYYDADAIREPLRTPLEMRGKKGWGKPSDPNHATPQGVHEPSKRGEGRCGENPTGRNKRSVWTVSTRSYKGAHFATFPPDLIRPCILAGTSEKGCCSACGTPWTRIVERTATNHKDRSDRIKATGGAINGGVGKNFPDTAIKTIGWQPTCICNAEVIPCTVLDPFAGSGTTGQVCVEEGRGFIGIELNEEYLCLAQQRIAKAQAQLALDVSTEEKKCLTR